MVIFGMSVYGAVTRLHIPLSDLSHLFNPERCTRQEDNKPFFDLRKRHS